VIEGSPVERSDSRTIRELVRAPVQRMRVVRAVATGMACIRPVQIGSRSGPVWKDKVTAGGGEQ
jgi:hypothetical protein